jgi:hypothetical protein
VIGGMVEPEPAAICAVCEKPRRPELAGPYVSAALADPFCSSTCCMTFYGVTTATIGEKKAGKRRCQRCRSLYEGKAFTPSSAEHAEQLCKAQLWRSALDALRLDDLR